MTPSNASLLRRLGAMLYDGLLVLAEFRAEDPAVPIKPLHKMTRRQIEKEITKPVAEIRSTLSGVK